MIHLLIEKLIFSMDFTVNSFENYILQLKRIFTIHFFLIANHLGRVSPYSRCHLCKFDYFYRWKNSFWSVGKNLTLKKLVSYWTFQKKSEVLNFISYFLAMTPRHTFISNNKTSFFFESIQTSLRVFYFWNLTIFVFTRKYISEFGSVF